MREEIKIGENKILRIRHDNGQFNLAIWDDEISVELSLDFEGFEKLRDAVNRAWEDWELELNVLEGNEL